MADTKKPAAHPLRKTSTPASRTPRKTDDGLVILDNPDDGELYETGDASDFAGETERGTRRDAGGRPKTSRKTDR